MQAFFLDQNASPNKVQETEAYRAFESPQTNLDNVSLSKIQTQHVSTDINKVKNY